MHLNITNFCSNKTQQSINVQYKWLLGNPQTALLQCVFSEYNKVTLSKAKKVVTRRDPSFHGSIVRMRQRQLMVRYTPNRLEKQMFIDTPDVLKRLFSAWCMRPHSDRGSLHCFCFNEKCLNMQEKES